MAAVDVSARVRSVALATLEAQSLGEEVGFDTTCGLVQTATGTAIAYTLLVSMRSPLLGQPPLANYRQIGTPFPTDEQIADAVSEGLRQVRELRRQVLAGGNGHAKVPAT